MPALGKKKKKKGRNSGPKAQPPFCVQGIPLLLGKAGAVIGSVALGKPVGFILCPESHFGKPEPAHGVILCQARR